MHHYPRYPYIIHSVTFRVLVNLALVAGLFTIIPAEGRIHRSHQARVIFQHEHPCPATGRVTGKCPGYVIDHIEPLVCGGADAPSNMQWQTIAEAKEKDRWERKACGK